MNGRLRIQILEGDDRFILENYLCGYLVIGNPAKNAVFQNFLPGLRAS